MKKLFFLSVVGLLLFSGCTAARNIRNSKKLRVGMTKNEVLAIIMDDMLLDKVIKAANGRKLTLLNISAETLHFDGKTAAPGETIC